MKYIRKIKPIVFITGLGFHYKKIIGLLEALQITFGEKRTEEMRTEANLFAVLTFCKT
jgi:hypothetical protein